MLRGDVKGAYGRGPLWVLLPTWSPNAAHVGDHIEAKVAWYVDVVGQLRGVVRPSEGCWEVAGKVGGSVLVFIVRIRAAART